MNKKQTRKVDSRKLKRMIELKEKDLSLREIAKIVDLSFSVVKYHLDIFKLRKEAK